MSILVICFLSGLVLARAESAARAGTAKPDLVPIADGGVVLEFQTRHERRYAFWARNSGDAPSKPSRIRLRLYYRDGWSRPDQPWTVCSDSVLDLPFLRPGEESRALVARLEYTKTMHVGIPSPPKQYRWEFTVDALDQVDETDEENNSFIDQGMLVQHDSLRVGASERSR